MRVEFSPAAVDDIEEITRGLADMNPRAARCLRERFVRVAASLQSHPNRGARLSFRTETRRLVVGKYLMLYGVGTDIVSVLRVLHGSRDIGALLGEDERRAGSGPG